MPAVTGFRPLTEIVGVSLSDGIHYTVECREHGELFEIAVPQSLEQAARQRAQHLAEHLRALADEIADAAR